MEWMRIQQVIFTSGPSAVIWFAHYLMTYLTACEEVALILLTSLLILL